MKENICDKCCKAILEYDNLMYYKTIKHFLRDNYYIFCSCNKRGLTESQAIKIEMEELWRTNYKIKGHK